VSALVAPLREENPQGRDIPRPYIILPPRNGAKCYQPGEQFVFGLTLFGNSIKLLPYIVLSIDVLERAGLGKRALHLHGQRGHFSVQRIDSYHPMTGERRIW
jgi:hypothetical protein